MRTLIYYRMWGQIEEQDYPEVGNIFTCLDPYERLGERTWIVMRKEKGHEATLLGVFWEEKDAVIFAQARAYLDLDRDTSDTDLN